MKIEKLTKENLTPFIRLVLELWDECDFDEEYEYYKKLINSDRDICYLVNDTEIYIAFIYLSIRNEYVEGADESPIAYIEGIYVKPEFQNKGIAKRLITEAEQWARSKNLKQIASDTTLTNLASIEFHKHIGFKEVERIVCFVKDL